MRLRPLLSCLSLLTVLGVAACLPADGDTPAGPVSEPLQTVFYLRVVMLDINHETAHRNLVCVITGFSGDRIIRIRDRKTGQDKEYRIVIDDAAFKAPQTLRLEVYTGLTSINVRCGALGVIGDSIQCEPMDERLNVARLVPGRDRIFDDAVRGHLNVYCEVQIVVPVGAV